MLAAEADRGRRRRRTRSAARYRRRVERALGRDLRFAAACRRCCARPSGARGRDRAPPGSRRGPAATSPAGCSRTIRGRSCSRPTAGAATRPAGSDPGPGATIFAGHAAIHWIVAPARGPGGALGPVRLRSCRSLRSPPAGARPQSGLSSRVCERDTLKRLAAIPRPYTGAHVAARGPVEDAALVDGHPARDAAPAPGGARRARVRRPPRPRTADPGVRVPRARVHGLEERRRHELRAGRDRRRRARLPRLLEARRRTARQGRSVHVEREPVPVHRRATSSRSAPTSGACA